MKNKIEKLVKAVAITSVFLFFGVSQAHAGTLTNFSYSAGSYIAGASTTYTFSYTIETALHTADMDLVAYPIFPSGFTVPGDFGPSDVTVTVNGSPRTVTEAWFGLGVRIDSDIAAGSNVVVQANRIINPSYGGTFNFVWVRTATGGGWEIDAPVSYDPINIITAPTIVSAKITGGNEITIVYSEAVTGETTDYTDFRINEIERNITNLSGDGTSTAILTFDGAAVGADTTGRIDINNPPTSVKSVSSNIDLALTNDLTVTDGQVPAVTKLGDGINDYSLPSTCPSTACDRGDIFGTQIIFSEELSSDGKTAVENAITAGASVAPRTFVWSGNRVRIYATQETTFFNDVTTDITDLANNTSYNITLIDSLFTATSEIWVDDDYTSESAGGHIWRDDAFDNITDAVDAIAEDGTIHVLAGTYTESIDIIKSGVTLAGPESGDEAIMVTDCDYAITIDEANDVTVSHLKLLQTNGGGIEDEYCYDEPVVRVGWDSEGTNLTANEIAGGYNGVALRDDSSENTLTDNYIHENDWGGIVMLGFGANSFTGNIIQNNEYGISLGYGPDRSEQQDISGTVISGNTISANDGYGIYYYEDDQDPSGDGVVVGPDNEITENGEGIYVDGNAYNLHINGNKIYGNILPNSALHVESSENGLDAIENWWGDESGPTIISNPTGTGDALSINNTQNSTLINFRPFCLDEDCNDLSEYEVNAENLDNLFGNGGTFTVAEGEDYTDITALSVNEDTIISLETGNGITTVTLPAGTIVTRTNGGNFSATDLEASEIDLGGLTGFADGETPLGAVQWGLPDMGLTFSQPIRIDLYVGTALNGQTLVIKRMPPEGGDWTDDGIVDPGTCEVSEQGICSFETTKASDFVALENSDYIPLDDEEEAQKAHIDSWKVEQYEKPDAKCVQRLKLNIKGKHFDEDAEVKIGGNKAFEVNRKSSKEITAKFCLEKLIDTKTILKRSVSVTNPDADTEKADKKIDLSLFTTTIINNQSQSNSEWIKSIQSSLSKLGYLDQQYITGIYGSITTEAIKKFQANNGIDQIGTVGPLTRAKLAEKLQ